MGEMALPPRPTDDSGIRSYEVYQRLRVHEASPVIRPRQLWSAEFRQDPYPLLHAVREHTPCYRDWIGNAFWVTRYDDVTSVFVDDANFETRTRRWWMGLADRGRSLASDIPVVTAITQTFDDRVVPVTEELLARLDPGSPVDLVAEVIVPAALQLWGEAFGVEGSDQAWFARTLLRMHRGTGWDPRHVGDAVDAFDELAAWFDRRLGDANLPRTGVLSVLDEVASERPGISGDDLAATLCESDLMTIPGSVANLFSLVLSHPGTLEALGEDRRWWKLAWLETMRHSPVIMMVARWTRHEVERFGLLLPAGARVLCSAAAANRDPRLFADPDAFRPGRKDLCQREARGHFRADGLPSAISLGTGAPSRFPAVPEDRPRSAFALARDTAVTMARTIVTTTTGSLAAVGSEVPTPVIHTDGGDRVCWSLPVRIGTRR